MTTNEQNTDDFAALYAEKIGVFKEKIKDMTKDELQDELASLQEDLQDIEIEKQLIIGQTGVHINAVTIQAYRESFDREIVEVQEKMNLVQLAMGV